MHLNGIAKRITALALGAALLTATALPAFAEGTQKVTYTAGNYTFEKISHPTKGTTSLFLLLTVLLITWAVEMLP